MEDNLIEGKKNIRVYIEKVLPNLKLTSPEKIEIADIIVRTYGERPYEKDVLKEIVIFLDKRPLFTRNLVGLEQGLYRTMEGNADEMIVVGKLIKMGFNCSRVDVTNSKYDAVIDKDGKLLRVQIKGTGGNTLDLTSGARSGQQISRDAPSRQRKLTSKDCDILIGVLKDSAICYVIPALDLTKFGNTVSLNELQEYKENWNKLK
jgi:hypothetical protein